jgi:high-affinity Fe2+/Pb2+ permease
VSRWLDWTAYAIVGGLLLAIAFAAIRGFVRWLRSIEPEEWEEFWSGLLALAIVAAAVAAVVWAFGRTWSNITAAPEEQTEQSPER